MMARHFVTLAAFLMEPQPRALAVLEVVLDSQRRSGAHAGEAVNHDADEGAIASPLSSVTSMESNSCRIAARCCLTDGLAIPAPSCSMQAATVVGLITSSRRSRCSHQLNFG